MAEHKAAYPFWTALAKAVFAGGLMTLPAWLLLAARGLGPRLAIIWAVGALIVLGQFNHVIISAVEIFAGMLLGAEIIVAAWLTRNFLPALVGNESLTTGYFFPIGRNHSSRSAYPAGIGGG